MRTQKYDAMKFISVRDLRGRSAEVWRQLAEEQELVITSNGKPIAILTATDEESLERSIHEIRRARAAHALGAVQQQSVDTGRNRMSQKEIDQEIAVARRTRRQ